MTVLSRSIASSILYWEMKSPSTGIIWMISSATMKDIRPRKRKRVTATAATKANSSATTTVSTVTIRLILQRVDELVGLEDGAVVVEVAAERHPGRDRVADLVAVEERAVDHPVDREDRDQEAPGRRRRWR